MATIKAGTYKISKTPNLINATKAGTTETIMTDGTAFIKDTVIQGGTEIECNGKGIQITWGGVNSSGVSTNASFMIVNATPNDYIWRISEASDGSSYQYRFANLTSPTEEQFDKVLTITLLFDVTVNQDLYDWWNNNTTSQASKLSVDLTTLSGWANLSAGNHTIKIKAKGTGYKDSELSTGVTVSKAASTVTLEAGTYKFVDSPNIPEGTDISTRFEFTTNSLARYGIKVLGSTDVVSISYYLYSSGEDDDLAYEYYTSGEGDKWAVQDPAFQTITLATDQQVSPEFYNWAITQGNLVKQTGYNLTINYSTVPMSTSAAYIKINSDTVSSTNYDYVVQPGTSSTNPTLKNSAGTTLSVPYVVPNVEKVAFMGGLAIAVNGSTTKNTSPYTLTADTTISPGVYGPTADTPIDEPTI